jgi:hypothetical protein
VSAAEVNGPTGPAGLALDQLGLDNRPLGEQRARGDDLEQHPRGDAPHIIQRLANRGQGRMDVSRFGDVVEADEGDIFRNPQAPDADRVQHCESARVARGKDRRRPIRPVEQRMSRPAAGLIIEKTLDHQGGIVRDVVLFQGGAIATQPVDARAQALIARDVPDPGVSEIEQILGRVECPLPVRAHHGGAVVRQTPDGR